MWLPYRAQPTAPLSYALYVFHDRAILQLASSECPKKAEPLARRRAGTEVPALGGSSRLSVLLLALAQEEQVQECQERGQRRRYVGEGRRRQDTLGTARLTVR